MSIQILDIVLYSHRGERRALQLRPGTVNVIAGISATGKSALIAIVDYVMGSDHCRVPEGPIRRSISWFGVRLQLPHGQAFIARRCPSPRNESSQDCFVDVGLKVELAEFPDLRQTTNVRGLLAQLTGWTGISEYIHEPAQGRGQPLAVSFRHALALCFQRQDEVIRQDQLFHGTAENFAAQALKDTLPFFLGAVDDDHVKKVEQLRRIRGELRSKERHLAELTAVVGDGTTKADALLAQARDVGLTQAPEGTLKETVAALRAVVTSPLSVAPTMTAQGAEYARLTDERSKLLQKQKSVRDEISAAKSFDEHERGFSREATEQRARLRTIGIFEGSKAGHDCPLCRRELAGEAVPSDKEMQTALQALGSKLESVSAATPRLAKAISDLEQRLATVDEQLSRNRAEMQAVRSANEQVDRMQNELAARSHIIGRISLYLESLPELPDATGLQKQIETLRDRCSRLDEELSDDKIRDRLTSILSLVNQTLSSYARELKLEHSESPLRLDVKRLTVVADKPTGPVTMETMGSGGNWIGYHLVAHLALHEWFTRRSRPVPRFLFLDQLSAAYYPAEKRHPGQITRSQNSDDDVKVARMFRLIFSVVNELTPGLQVILTEHAEVDEPWFQSAVVARWSDGEKLVPENWPEQE